jgi:hypothetical protein
MGNMELGLDDILGFEQCTDSGTDTLYIFLDMLRLLGVLNIGLGNLFFKD